MDSAFTLLNKVTGAVYVEGLVGSFYLQNLTDLVRYRGAFGPVLSHVVASGSGPVQRAASPA